MKVVVLIQNVFRWSLIFVQSHRWICLNEIEINLVAEKFTDVVHTISVRSQYTMLME